MDHANLLARSPLLAVGLLVWPFLGSCDMDKEQSKPAPKRFSGVTDDRHYVHPKVSQVGRMVVKGCCSFDFRGAEVSQLLGDVDGRLVRGPGYRIEIAFGHRIAPLGPAFTPAGHRNVDGVSVVFFRAGSRMYALQATIPLSREAVERGIDFPQVQAVGSCDGDEGCQRLKAALDSIRF